MGRWKMGPQGGYYDQNDSGPDQYTPTPAEAGQATPQPAQPGTGYTPPYGGIRTPRPDDGNITSPEMATKMPIPMNGITAGTGAKIDPATGQAVPAGKDMGMSMLPGQAGAWSWKGSNGSGNGTLEQMLAQLQQYYGGGMQPTAKPASGGLGMIQTPQTPSAMPRQNPQAQRQVPLGGAIGSLFGR